MKSLYSGVAGMKTHNQRMDVIGNNISNVNTTGYKTSEVTFKDVYYQTKANASSGDSTSGGKNPTQIGYGSQLGTVSQVMVQSGFTYTDSKFNCAIQGEGFFQVMDDSGNIYYSRAGKFAVDSYGNLCDPNGNIVLGVSGDPTGIETGQSQRVQLKVPAVDNNVASATKTVNGYEITVSANTFGEEGNVNFTIVDSDTPYATRSGSSLTVYMDLDQDFGQAEFERLNQMERDNPGSVTDTMRQDAVNNALQEFNDALNEALYQGGVGLPDGVLPLSVEFESLPQYNDVQALNANNTMTLTYKDSGTGNEFEMDFTVTADKAGEFANKYEVDLKSTTSQNYVTAKWKDSILTVTVPASGVAYREDGTAYDNITDAINDAINAASDANHKLTVDTQTYSVTTDETTGAKTRTATTDPFDFSQAVGNRTERLGLDSGRDNFFSDIATALSTVNLTDGRTAKEQAVDDLETIQIDTDGTIYGRHAVHGLLVLGRIDIATFENPTGLEQVGTSLWRASLASGEPQVKIGGSDGAGEVIQGALEMSNVDLAQEFSDMIITQRGYQANSRIITVSDTMLEELVNLKR